MLSTLEFNRFRGFERLRADLSPHAYIVGPNSAGKSTILEAISLAERCLQRARRTAPTMRVEYRGGWWRAYPLNRSSDEEEDPIRFDFGNEEVRASIRWSDEGLIHMVWPEASDLDMDEGFFYLEVGEGAQPKNQATTKELFPPVTIVPVLTPIDRVEEVKDSRYVRSQALTRRASRHFRNHAFLMDQAGEWDAFKQFCIEWLPEIELLDVNVNWERNRLSVYYAEPGSRVPKELAWAGDGYQIWVQLLLHLYRAEGTAAIVLDEPDVYLHPDLQRRLVRLLDRTGSQVLLASHSADVITEAPDGGVLWVDRKQRSARRTSSPQLLAALSDSLGSSYNLALARSMRSRAVILTDCDDLRVLRQMARQAGALNLVNEQAVSIVKLEDPADWSDHRSVASAIRSALPDGLHACVLIGAGLRPPATNRLLLESFAGVGIFARLLSLPQLDSYLLEPRLIARISGSAPETVAVRMAESIDSLRDQSRAALLAQWVASAPILGSRNALTEGESYFDERWESIVRRKEIVLASRVFQEVNAWLERDGYRVVNAYALARGVKVQEMAPEVLRVILELDGRAN